MTRLEGLFRELPWHQLVPEQGHAIVTEGFGQSTSAVLTAQTPDKRLSLSYVPSTRLEARELSIDLGQFAGPVDARWFNPTNAKYISVAESLLRNRGIRKLRTPGDNGTKTSDWLLIAQVH